MFNLSGGISKLRGAIAHWYKIQYGVKIDLDTEAVVTIGAKEGLAHLVLATIGPGDVVFVPTPAHPIHTYSVIIAGGNLRTIPLTKGRDFIEDLRTATRQIAPPPKMLIISFPHNLTTQVVDQKFFERIVEFAKAPKFMVVQDFAYGDLVFESYEAPRFLQAAEAKDGGVKFYTLSKSFSMAGGPTRV